MDFRFYLFIFFSWFYEKSSVSWLKKKLLDPFASIGRAGTSKGKVKVRDILSKYLISNLIFQLFHSYMKKKFKVFSKK